MQTGPDEDTLESAVEEARRTFDKQVAELGDIDEKAMRLVRTDVIILGFVVSAVGIAGPQSFDDIGLIPTVMVWAGVSSLLVSAFVGSALYSITEFSSGVGSEHLQFAKGATHREWLTQMLAEYEQWSHEVSAEIESNAEYFDWAQLLQFLGAGLLFLSSTVTVGYASYGVEPRESIGAFLGGAAVGWLAARLIHRDT